MSNKKTPVRAPSGAAVMKQSVTDSIERALFEEWAQRGYAALSMEAIAKRAGVGKAAIYRRWSSKLAMVEDVLTRVGSDLAVSPDTGDLRTDIQLLLAQLRHVLQNPLVARIVPDLHAEMPRTPKLATAIRGRLQTYRRNQAKLVLQRAIERGDLKEDLDLDLAIDLLGSMIYWRMIITQQRTGKAYMEGLLDFIVGALQNAK